MVYFKNSDKVVSSFGNMDFSMYCELYCFDEGETAARDRLKTHLSEYHSVIPSGWTVNGQGEGLPCF